MKHEIIKILKRYKLLMLIEIIFIIINVYCIAYPSKIVGQIIDLLYNINQNKAQIYTKLFLEFVGC